MDIPEQYFNEGEQVWDPQQRSVIDAAPDARIIVEAGPGMGKTAVACARVANLINQGLDPANIWLVSFTRTAVKEIRDRINQLVDEHSSAVAVRISTLDSHVWYLRQGFDYAESQELFGSYEANIQRLIEMLQTGHDGLQEYFDTMQHLIVDEAQDLVGDRSQLILEIICRLPNTCGITVFVDSAQAIYGFAGSNNYKTEPIKKKLLENHDLGFIDVSLTTIHRTESESLKTIFSDVREFVLDTSVSGSDKYSIVRDSIIECADETEVDVLSRPLAGRDDVLVLFRRRAEVLTASSFLRERKIAHRLRMSGLPVYIPGWIAHLFANYTDRFMTDSHFIERWESKFPEPVFGLPDPDSAWSLLLRLAGERRGRIDRRLLRDLLARKQPPVEISVPELGTSGPILSTIHASKGREAPETYLMIPSFMGKDEDDIDEEVRVLFVGATRGKQFLRVGAGFKFPSKALGEGGRAFRIRKQQNKYRMQVEIGRENDVDVISSASRLIHHDRVSAIMFQGRMLNSLASPRPAFAVYDPNDNFTYRIFLDDEQQLVPVASFTNAVNSDLFSICREIENIEGRGRYRPPDRMMQLYVIGARTVAISEDDPRAELLYHPFSETGIFLAPVVSGFPTMPVLKPRRRWN